MGKKICERCKKKIKDSQKAVLLKTFTGEETEEEVYWHFQCFLDWRDESLQNRAMKIYNKTMNSTISKLNKAFNMNQNNEEETKENNIL